ALGGKQAYGIEEHIVFVTTIGPHEIGAETEIERPVEVRRQAEFLTKLRGFRSGDIDGDQSVRASQLRVAENAPVRPWLQHALTDRSARHARLQPGSGGRIETVEVLQRPNLI